MKTILLENGFPIDIPEELIHYCERNNIDYEYKDARFLFWKENRADTIKFFSELPVGQKLICSTVFDGFAQLELFIELFYGLKHKKFEFKIMNPSLCNNLMEFYDYYESSICPETDEYNDDPKLRTEFKLQINKKFEEVLEYHNIYQIYNQQEIDIYLKDLETIKQNCY